MQTISLSSLGKRSWKMLVAVVVVTAAGFGVYRLQGIFGSDNGVASGGAPPSEIVAFNPKTVTLEVFGAPGTVATINYLDVDASPQQARDAALPWSHTMTTTLPAVFGDLVAQGDSDFIGCRITVDGVVKVERTVYKVNAYTFCLDKSS
ncbi:MAG: MmpS family transport accessory protein [Mycolicibacter algericus]|uniref:MmpS family transport accessory protein n=1 Tax=Mycolicibacter algericus TaxID=1288388 RepID=UPI003C71E39F